MNVQDLFDYPTLRAVLTVSESELPDSLLQSFHVEDDVEVELDRRVPAWASLSDPKQVRLLRLFAKYVAGSQVATTASVFILKKETDGNNEGQRSDKDGFAYISASLRAKAETALADLLALVGDEPVDPMSLLDRVQPLRDIITEPRS